MAYNRCLYTTLIATGFGVGKSPKAPGTMGTLAALPFGWLLGEMGGASLLAIATAITFLVGWWASAHYVKISGREDPSEVVIDEVAGMWLTLCFMPQEGLFYGLAFVAFRFFDIVKPWPVSWADKRVKGGFGIMLDDILAGLYAAPLPYFVMIGYLWITSPH
jgi:phosphatidylglycerophosphatase A